MITEPEKLEIARVVGMIKGHWYKCPNGHPFVIGKCGGANQISRCICGEQIGGEDYRLLSTNDHAGEMDGSERHA
ncbi:hypothetical protein GWI33_011869 [Rhynchophorus ferrugineus]|uniref:RZ-type domain-containing protein n=1 Tax=Rhynchophorus ferrugineus TaxID=354439 RepID=A0A834ICA2_RHYFE|nr:hypothetical protein GWI33_011869 [Rhynchophorus ferrugineus]